MQIETDIFGSAPDSHPVKRYTLTNSAGHRACLMSWGAAILEVEVPDRAGTLANVNCVFDSLEPYLTKHPYFGSTVGRFCGRIRDARFEIDGQEFLLTVNHRDKHHIHGGIKTFAHQNWQSQPIEEPGIVGVRFDLLSRDGHEGYPGNVEVTATYRWNESSELTLEYSATTDAATHLNITNHSYWNLAGVDSGGVGLAGALDHQLTIHADQVLELTDEMIPTGRVLDVEGTVFDFRHGRAISDGNDQLELSRGYDHCFIIRGPTNTLRMAATASDPKTGRVLEVETTQPGVQFYAGGHLPGGSVSAGLGPHEAFCLETQHFPDSPHHPDFPSTLLRPGETFSQTTQYRFSTDTAQHPSS